LKYFLIFYSNFLFLFNVYSIESSSSSLTKLFSVIKTTKKSLDICVYEITLNQIINGYIKLHKNNVNILIITNGNNKTYGYRLTNRNKDHKMKFKSLQTLRFV
jgi:hypothetical protein